MVALLSNLTVKLQPLEKVLALISSLRKLQRGSTSRFHRPGSASSDLARHGLTAGGFFKSKGKAHEWARREHDWNCLTPSTPPNVVPATNWAPPVVTERNLSLPIGYTHRIRPISRWY
jgi:hypothetical protein